MNDRDAHQRTVTVSRRRSGSLVATALVASFAGIGLGAAPAQAEGASRFSGYVASGWAAPVKIEIFEPSIPIPADPQLEIELGYTVVKADSGSGKGRGSWMWPGDPIGEGLKTIVEQMGLPAQLGENGYPVQVNSDYPSGEASASDEPMPGMVMRTGADETQTWAEVGFSPDADIAALPDRDRPIGTPSGTSDGGLLGIPGLPALPVLGQIVDLTKLPGVSELATIGDQLTAGGTKSVATPGLPPQLAGIIDFSGYSSTSHTYVEKDRVRTVTQSALGDVRLIGGLVRLEGVTAKHTSTSNGVKATSAGETTVGGIVVAGTRFAWTDRGFEVAGQVIPGLPDDPTAALQMLGITITQPKVSNADAGLRAEGLAEGLKIQLDASILGKALKVLPLQQLIDLVPEQAKELKTVVSLVAGLSPRMVVTLGNAGTATETVTAMAPPTVGPGTDSTTPVAAPGPQPEPTPALPEVGGPLDGNDTGAGMGSGGAPDLAAPGAPVDSVTGPAQRSAEAPVLDAAPMGAGLPPLTSLPGLLTLLSLGLAGAAGFWLRRAGILALGSGASCTHGLDSGLPDLRKM